MLKWKLTQALLLTLLAVVGFGLLTILTFGEQLQAFDTQVITWVQGWESPALTTTMKLFSDLGSTLGVVIVTILILGYLYFVLRHRSEYLLFFVVVAGSAGLNQAMKLVFHRLRPDLHRLAEASGYSFPSGHSMSAFALYGILTFLLWRHISTRWGRALILIVGVAITLVIGLSRIYLGVHYPTDVLGGYLAGGFWLAASMWVYQSVAESRSALVRPM
ncbi:phosphatase PAP2 family protein [Tumebacillus permanentifrigoris]|uniref:Undecaprenyl-diphosphatase n=1 Tax=Tumebacillus permanentifrigoris TaxID=378543 RepID=A0A316DFN1_9BACL|nr:phosphatase PAP2 family protein [Tumebacillus permanentifrigoris]PWK14984.1 undecaprenyl-diphosphatase [Tumebacillus permanentifrigoris]